MNVNFQATLHVPNGTPIADVEDWLRFELGLTGQLLGGNALIKLELGSAELKDFRINSWCEDRKPSSRSA